MVWPGVGSIESGLGQFFLRTQGKFRCRCLMAQAPTDTELLDALHALLSARGPDKSICPSEVPRRIMGEQSDWRAHLKRTRQLARPLIAAGQVVMLKKGKPVHPVLVKGVVRLAQGKNFPPESF